MVTTLVAIYESESSKGTEMQTHYCSPRAFPSLLPLIWRFTKRASAGPVSSCPWHPDPNAGVKTFDGAGLCLAGSRESSAGEPALRAASLCRALDAPAPYRVTGIKQRDRFDPRREARCLLNYQFPCAAESSCCCSNKFSCALVNHIASSQNFCFKNLGKLIS